jgi:hypothetical protein
MKDAQKREQSLYWTHLSVMGTATREVLECAFDLVELDGHDMWRVPIACPCCARRRLTIPAALPALG